MLKKDGIRYTENGVLLRVGVIIWWCRLVVEGGRGGLETFGKGLLANI